GDGGVATNAVSVRDNFFTPTPANVAVGDTVTWTWQGTNPHTVTFDPDDSPTSPIQTSGTYRLQFDTPGTFTFYCTVHGRAIMSGSVVVE
ncbi:MAG: cupredoxin domain-containing protein, partial [Gemmatimonadota bacterium]